MKLLRARPISFDTGTAIHRVQPPTVGAYTAALALEPADPASEGSETRRARIVAQAKILVGEPSAWIDTLDQHQVAQLLIALCAVTHGIDPENAVALDDWLKKKALCRMIGQALSPR